MGENLLLWQNLHPLRGDLHIARTVFMPSTPGFYHNHDFAEICWIESGRIRHETPGGQQELGRGAVVLVAPGQPHRLSGVSGGGTIANIALSAERLADLRQRWGDQQWPWSDSQEVAIFQWESADLAAVVRRCNDYTLGPATALDRDLLLGDMVARLRPIPAAPWGTVVPWLDAALRSLAEPAGLREGLPLLVRVSGRSREHIARAIRQACGCSPTALLQDLRLRAAEQALVASEEAVAAIGDACGLPGRAHFHRLFRARYGQTPAQYRRRSRQTVGG
jgi:AraC family transcriptional regulator, dual regulator of chb operon